MSHINIQHIYVFCYETYNIDDFIAVTLMLHAVTSSIISSMEFEVAVRLKIAEIYNYALYDTICHCNDPSDIIQHYHVQPGSSCMLCYDTHDTDIIAMTLMLYDTDIDCIVQHEYHRFNPNNGADIDGLLPHYSYFRILL